MDPSWFRVDGPADIVNRPKAGPELDHTSQATRNYAGNRFLCLTHLQIAAGTRAPRLCGLELA